MSNFTPGPWKGDPLFPTSVWADGKWVATTNTDSSEPMDRREANAALIAEAPTAHDLIVRAVTGIDIEWIVEAHAYLGKVAGGAQ